MKKLAVATLMCVSSLSFAEDQVAEDIEKPKRFDGTIDLGYGSASGNSDTDSTTLRALGEFDTGHYLNQVELQMMTASQNGVTSKERYLASYQLNRDLSETISYFGRAEYNDDRFSGFDYQNSVTTGASVNWITPDPHKLTTELGVGYRYSKLKEEDDLEETIVRLAGNYDWQATETTLFTQSLSSEIGKESTISRSVSSVAVAVSESIALKVTQQFKFYSDPAPGTEHSDRDTSVSITYVY